MSSATMIKALGERMAFEQLSKSELEKLARAEELSMEIVQLGRMISSIGMLVSSDGEGRSGPRAGSFQSADDVTELLFCLGELVEAKGELVSIANNAQWKLGQVNGATQ